MDKQFKYISTKPDEWILKRIIAVAAFHQGLLYDKNGKKIPVHLLPESVLLAIKKLTGTSPTSYSVEPYDLTQNLIDLAKILNLDIDTTRLNELAEKEEQDEIVDTIKARRYG